MRLIALFPGQGSQHSGMGKEVYDNFKVAKLAYEEASDALKLDLKKLCFDTSDSELKLTANTQPALLVSSIATWRAFAAETGQTASAALGHSLGEYSALVAAQALSLADGIRSVRVRGQAMQEAVPVGQGGMQAVLGLHDDAVIKACEDFQNKVRQELTFKDAVLEAANFNAPGQVVVSGHTQALDYFKTHFSAADYGSERAKIIPLPVSAPFHSRLMKPAADRLKEHFKTVHIMEAFSFPVVHNVTAEPNQNASVVKELLIQQMTKPVLWSLSVRRLGEAHHEEPFVEFGSGRILAGLNKKIWPDRAIYTTDTLENFKKAVAAVEAQ